MAAWKTINVFISSTFRDMHAERDYLVRFVFPKLREELAERRIQLVDIDLRWGVTSDEDALSVCRDVIDDCRPRFLCLLGGRYGWVPPGLSRSITADEVRYASLENRFPVHQFFYFRSPVATESMVELLPGEYREAPGSVQAQKLRDLKNEIEQAGFEPFTYSPRWDHVTGRLIELDELGRRVAADIRSSVVDEFGIAENEPVGPYDHEYNLMEAFAQERSKRYVVGSRDEILDAMVAFAVGDGDAEAIVLSGESGNGKSALLAVTSELLKKHESNPYVLTHFVGAGAPSCTLLGMLRRFCHELNRFAGISSSTPEDIGQLVAAFRHSLAMAAEKSQVILVIDALNQMTAADHAHELQWIPQPLPPAVKIIASSTPHTATDAAARRPSFYIHELLRLQPSDAELIIDRFLKRYGKEVEPTQRQRLLSKPDSGSPLYLSLALEELRTLGQFESITEVISALPGNCDALFEWLFVQRLSSDPGFRDADGRPNAADLVSRFAAYLGVSRHGLSLSELVALIDQGDPQGNVAALQRLLRPYCLQRGELIDFQHQQIREVVQRIYLSDPSRRKQTHKDLAAYFRGAVDADRYAKWNAADERALRELPHHMVEAEDYDGVKQLVADGFLETYATRLGDGEALALAHRIAVWYAGRGDERRAELLTVAYAYSDIVARVNDVADVLGSTIERGEIESAKAIIAAESNQVRRGMLQYAAGLLLSDAGQVVASEELFDEARGLELPACSLAQRHLVNAVRSARMENKPLPASEDSVRPLETPGEAPLGRPRNADQDSTVLSPGVLNQSTTERARVPLKLVLLHYGYDLGVMWTFSGVLFPILAYEFFQHVSQPGEFLGAMASPEWFNQLVIGYLIIGCLLTGIIRYRARAFAKREAAGVFASLVNAAMNSGSGVRSAILARLDLVCRFVSANDKEGGCWQDERYRQSLPNLRTVVKEAYRETKSNQEIAELIITGCSLGQLVCDDLATYLREENESDRVEVLQVVLDSIAWLRLEPLRMLRILAISCGPNVDPELLVRMTAIRDNEQSLESSAAELHKLSRKALADAFLSSIQICPVRPAWRSKHTEVVLQGLDQAKSWLVRPPLIPFGRRLVITLFLVPIIIFLLIAAVLMPGILVVAIPLVLAARIRDSLQVLRFDPRHCNTGTVEVDYLEAMAHRFNSSTDFELLHELFPRRWRTINATHIVRTLMGGYFYRYTSRKIPAIPLAVATLCRPEISGGSSDTILRLMNNRRMLDQLSRSTAPGSAAVPMKVDYLGQCRRMAPLTSSGLHFVSILSLSWIALAVALIVLCRLSTEEIREYFLSRGWILLAVWSALLVFSQVWFRQYHKSRLAIIAFVMYMLTPYFYAVNLPGIIRWEYSLIPSTILFTHWLAPDVLSRWRGTHLLFPSRRQWIQSRFITGARYFGFSVLLGAYLYLIILLSKTPFWLTQSSRVEL